MSKRKKDNHGRHQAPKERTPQGDGLFKQYVPTPGATFLMFGAEARSGIDAERRTGIVMLDVGGKWNHGARDELSIITKPETARELGALLLQAADAAEQDEAKFKGIFE